MEGNSVSHFLISYITNEALAKLEALNVRRRNDGNTFSKNTQLLLEFLFANSRNVVYINPLQTSGYYTYHLSLYTKTLHSAPRVYLCVPYGSHNEQRLFPQTALTVGLYSGDVMCFL
jgi:hypothetical protein